MKLFVDSLLLTALMAILICHVDAGVNTSSYMKCAKGCVCQYAHLMDLPIFRWINYMQIKRPDRSVGSKGIHPQTREELVNENEVAYEEDEGYIENPLIKQATCIIQVDNDVSTLVQELPEDLQALVLVYTSQGKNKTVPTSAFKPLTELTTLEIRGLPDRSFRLIIDEPMTSLHNANFESITLIGSEHSKRPKNPVLPHDSFDYVPSSEQIAYNVSLESKPEDEEIEVVPYEVYIMEIKKSRMATFYGWDHLKVLRINRCKLDELQWEMFDGLLELQHLSLEHNDIKIVPAFALYGAMHIKTLSLAYNYILEFTYRSLAGLLELEVLDLSHNNLTSLSELSFPPFPRLEYIDFRHNPIKHIFPASFGVMNNTRVMHLGSKETAAELWGNEPFSSLELLKILTISNVSIGILEHDVFQDLHSLEVLTLKGRIRSIEFDAFADMSRLRELHLSECNIREISMDAFIGCKRLEIIDLSKNNLSFIPPGLFDDQTQLRELFLQNNNLKFLPSTFFHHPALKLVRLTDNPWKCTCDMLLWKQKLTNQHRGGRTSRCIKDFRSGKILSCRKYDTYVFDKSLAPRCTNFNGHSVFYAVRKDLRCNLKREINRNHRHQISQGKLRQPKHKQLEERREMYKNKLHLKKTMNRQIEHPMPVYQGKFLRPHKGISHVNSLQYLTGPGSRYNRSEETTNNIFGGRIDDQLDFNSI